jgi:hypothetical protein
MAKQPADRSDERRTTNGRLSLALRANPEKFQPVGHALKSVLRGNPFLHLVGKTFLHFHGRGTLHTNKMMMVSVIPFFQQLKPTPVPEIKTFDHPFLLQHVHRSIDRREVTDAAPHSCKDLAHAQGANMLPEDLENRLPRPSHLARASPQSIGQD